MSRSQAFTALPVWWQVEAASQARVRAYRKGSRLLTAGSTSDFVFFIKKGSVAVEGAAGGESEERRVLCTFKEHDVVGQLECFTGCAAACDVRVVSDTCQVYVLAKDMVARAFSEDQLYIPNLIEGLVEHILDLSTAAPDLVEGWTRPQGMPSGHYLSTLTETVVRRLCDIDVQQEEPPPLLRESQINFRSHVLPGLNTIRSSWEALADRSPTIDLRDFLALEGYVGEIGEKFFSTMKAALYQIIQTRILRDYQDDEYGDEIVHVLSTRLQSILKNRKNAQEVVTDIDIPDLDLNITENLWWHCWLIAAEQSHSESFSEGLHALPWETANSHSDTVLMGDLTRSELLDIGVLEEIWAFLTWSYIHSDLFSKNTLDKYEAAYLLTVGNLTENLTREQIPMFLSLLLPERKSVSRYNVGEFLQAFAKDGLDSHEVPWSTLRKITREKKRDLESYKDDSEQIFMSETSAYIFNPLCMPIQAWFFFVRFVAIYHLMVVPVRIVYQPFTHPGQLELLSTDLPADILTFLHIFVAANTSYQNKKSRWVLSRVKILKNYAAKSFFVDLLAAFPFDWLSMAQVFVSVPACVSMPVCVCVCVCVCACARVCVWVGASVSVRLCLCLSLSLNLVAGGFHPYRRASSDPQDVFRPLCGPGIGGQFRLQVTGKMKTSTK